MRNPICIALSGMFLFIASSIGANANDPNCDGIGGVIKGDGVPDCAKVPPRKEVQDAQDPEGESASEDENARGQSGPIPSPIWKAMQGKSWHRKLKCPARNKLSLLEIPYWNFEYERKIGQMIVARDSASNILDVFEELYDAGFPIAQMRLVHHFGGNDNRSMAANNTSAFNCRRTTLGRRLSEHSYGRAIDINPRQNPYVTRSGRVYPPNGRKFKSGRHRKRRGMIQSGDRVVQAFRKVGWKWGGNWSSVKDYQHFSKSGR